MRSLVDVPDDLVELLLADDRAHIACLVERIADFHLGELRRERVEEAIEDALVDEQPRASGAGLALPCEAHCRDDALRGDLVGGVGKKDLRALAAELERDRDDAVSRPPEDCLARLGVPSERDLLDERVLRERRSDFLAGSGDNIEHAFR